MKMHRQGLGSATQKVWHTLTCRPLSSLCYRLAARAKGKGKAAKTESAVPFKAASPMKQAPAAQAGTFYGTIGGKIPYIPVCSPGILNLCVCPETSVFQT